ncbi:29383_t:CDS:2, partial [Racocetra persica]
QPKLSFRSEGPFNAIELVERAELRYGSLPHEHIESIAQELRNEESTSNNEESTSNNEESTSNTLNIYRSQDVPYFPACKS